MVAGLATTLSSDHYATQGRRYLTPFFPLLAVLVATSVVGLGKVLLASPRPAWLPRWLRAGVAALLLLLLAWPVGRACRDHVRRYAQYFARCCRDIHNQQVKLGRTIREQLPAGAVVGIYDAGAMAYFGERAIYDLAGLCTNDNARPWRDGEGATFERIERTPATRRPTHFAVYRGFFRAPGWFGRLLATTHLDEVTIAGGEDCDLTQAPADFFDSGASPERPPPGNQLRDEIDVADLESEDAHGFASQPGPATRRPGWRGLSQLAVHAASSGSTAPTGLAESSVPAAAVPRHQIADGGRPLTGWQRMRLVVDAGRDATLVVRLGSATGGKLVLFLDDVEVERVNLPPKAARFEERMLLLPASRFGGRGQHNLEARWLSGEVSVYHYWVYQRAE
jgi:hypothetical protein